MHQLVVLLQTGQLKHPDLMVAVVAAAGHFLMIAACVYGFARMHPRLRQWTEFVTGGVLSIVYFAAIIVTTGPQYIGLLKRAFRV